MWPRGNYYAIMSKLKMPRRDAAVAAPSQNMSKVISKAPTRANKSCIISESSYILFKVRAAAWASEIMPLGKMPRF